MTPLARRRLQMRMKKAFKEQQMARKRHQRAVARYKKLQKQFRAA